MINKISFGSTYQIGLTEPGINPAKKERIKEYIKNNYENYLIPSSNSGSVKVSMDETLDAKFEQTIKTMGFKVFKKFPFHNVKSSDIPDVIAAAILDYNYQQFGKQKVKKTKSK